MRSTMLTVALLLCCSLASLSCSKESDNPVTANPATGDTTQNQTGVHMQIKIGSSTFDATLANNSTGDAFKAMLPITVQMTELNGNEKYANLPSALPTAASNPGTIHNGDLMLYQSNVLVLFYATFSTSYSYTKIGSVTDPGGLQAALGTGNVSVTFELK